ncbi:MAG: imidazole glycerol phosphate synthase subunit HisF [Desulfohalobiaceae bacterium]
MVTLLDYGAGNVRSVHNAITNLGYKIHIAQGPEDILQAQTLVFPGVGSFGSMMATLQDKGYTQPLLEYLSSGRPFLGICLGLQALFQGSEEAPGIPGLGFLQGHVQRFRTELSVPHIGWNGVRVQKPSRLFQGFAGQEKVYFVHSFHVVPEDPGVILSYTDYGSQFVSSIQIDNILATQFHPEKSGDTGLALFRNFLDPESRPSRPGRSPSSTRLAKRIVACLDVRSNEQGDLVVTKGDQYDVREQGKVRNLGKPVELAERYYQEGADEIVFLNITGFRDFPLLDLPMLEVLKQTSQGVFVPLTIGGGIRDYTDSQGRSYSALEVAAQYFRSGADKISLGSEAVDIAQNYLETGQKTKDSAIETISAVYGSQAVVISIDPRRRYVFSAQDSPHLALPTQHPGPEGQGYCWFQCTVKGGREGRELDAVTLARTCEELGAGEILLNSIDQDGTNSGFDLELIQAVSQAVQIPVIASSGAGSVEHFLQVFGSTQAQAALAAGIFHRREVPIKTVKEYLGARVEIRP